MGCSGWPRLVYSGVMVMYCHNQINMNYIEKNAPNTEPIGILYPVRCRLFNLSDSNVHTHYNLDAW